MSTEQITLDMTAFREAFARFADAIIETGRQIDALVYSRGREYPHRSAMHAAYHAKTRRRSRRRTG